MNQALVYPYGDTTITGTIKSQLTDFKVDEELGFEPEGKGEHLFLLIEKIGLSTHELIDLIASDFKLKPRNIGYSGLKDKHAVTRQWLSLQLPGQSALVKAPPSAKYTILKQGFHRRKLKPGTHRSNHFKVIIRDVSALSSATHNQIELIDSEGMANYFGQQRFGQKQDNVGQALRVFGNERRTGKLSRRKKGLYLSALRSHLFNQVLSHRIHCGHWNGPVEGDVFMLAGSQSIFHQAINQELLDRFDQRDISSTVSLYGAGNRMLEGKALALEDRVLADFEEIGACLLQQKARLAMRATRVVVENLNIDYSDTEQTLLITAALPRGSYFTTLLNHFVSTRSGAAD